MIWNNYPRSLLLIQKLRTRANEHHSIRVIFQFFINLFSLSHLFVSFIYQEMATAEAVCFIPSFSGEIRSLVIYRSSFNFQLKYYFLIIFDQGCSVADSEALKASAASEMRTVKRCPTRRRKMLIPTSIMSCLESTRRQLHSKSERPSGRRHSRNIPIRVETQRNSKRYPERTRCSATQKKDSSMMIMDRKASKMEDLQVEQVASAVFSRCSEAEEKSHQAPEKARPSLSNSR